jgi:hypothetical protein
MKPVYAMQLRSTQKLWSTLKRTSVKNSMTYIQLCYKPAIKTKPCCQ